jgi:addiction module RelB/DinJ family antitoxin
MYADEEVRSMGETTSMNLRIDKTLKKEAETLFETLGINMTTAINIFLRQSVRDQGIPFQITANKGYNDIPAHTGRADRYKDYQEYVIESLKEADLKVADGTMKYYTADEIRSKLEDVLNEKK